MFGWTYGPQDHHHVNPEYIPDYMWEGPYGEDVPYVETVPNHNLKPTPISICTPKVKVSDTDSQRALDDLKTALAAFKPEEDRMQIVPGSIRCTCGRVDKLCNVFDCSTCSEFGLCALCAMRKHKNHETEGTLPNAVRVSVNSSFERNLKKLTKWTQALKIVREKGGQSCDKLCNRLREAYKISTENGKTRDVEELMAACEVSVLDGDVRNVMEANVKLLESLEMFSGRLEKCCQMRMVETPATSISIEESEGKSSECD